MASTARNSKQPRAKTLCQRSSEIALNITKLSSLYLARVTLGSRRPTTKRTVEIPVSSHELQEGKRSLEPESSSVPKYVMEPAKADGVDGQAAKYILRVVTERNQSVDPGVRKEVSRCNPPPPTDKWATSYSH